MADERRNWTIIEIGPGEYISNGEEVMIGRNRCFGLSVVSRQHCRLRVANDGENVGEVYLADLGSTNGTFVDGQAVGETDYHLKQPTKTIITLGAHSKKPVKQGWIRLILKEDPTQPPGEVGEGDLVVRLKLVIEKVDPPLVP